MKYTIITGATSGIGLELASIYAKNDHNLILIARRIEVLEMIKNELEAKYGVSILCFSCDLSKTQETIALFNELNQSYSIICLINNAGMGIFESIGQLSTENIEYQNTINFTSPVIATNLLIENLKQNNGSVINICSILSYIANNKKSIYVANKHALYGFSKGLRLEYKDVHVLTVHPATVKTAFFKEDYYNNKKVLLPSVVASKIFKAYQKKKRKIDLPKGIVVLRILSFLFPRLVDRLNIKYFSNK